VGQAQPKRSQSDHRGHGEECSEVSCDGSWSHFRDVKAKARAGIQGSSAPCTDEKTEV
jgi:hypothetical protein